MNHKLLGVHLGLLALASGCGRAAPVLPSTPTDDPAGVDSRTSTVLLGRYSLEVDPVGLTANVVALRTAQENDAVYLLPIDNFFAEDTFKVTDVRLTPTTLDIDYVFTHPFPASGTSNRADLGVCGYLLFLADVDAAAGNTFFAGSDDIVVNTDLVANADAYWAPRDLIDTGSLTANTFPYRLFVDEELDSRRNTASGSPVSNGGDPTGNYAVPNGWQTGGSETWTGFGALHQGQQAPNTLSLALAALEGGEFALDFAAVAKYNDPRSATPGKLHRLPGNPPSLLDKFGYRMPHGALDVEQLTFEGEGGGFFAGQATSSELRFHVRDWDAAATETAEAALADEPDGSKVTVGASGAPNLALCIPGVLGDEGVFLDLGNAPTADDLAYGGDAGADSGEAGDELFYAAVVAQDAAPGQLPGSYTGLLRATDPEAAGTDYLIPLHGDLSPVTGATPLPITYQAFNVDVAPVPGWVAGFTGGGTEYARAVTVDSSGNIYATGSFGLQATFGGPLRTAAGDSDIFLVKLQWDGSYVWDKTFGSATDVVGEQGVTVACDSANNIWLSGFFENTADFGGGSLTSAGGHDAFLVKLDPDGNHLLSKRFGGTSNDMGADICVGATDAIFLTGNCIGTINLGGPNLTSGGLQDIYVGCFAADGTHVWSRGYGGTNDDGVSAAASYPDGSVGLTGYFRSAVDFGGGFRTSIGSDDIFMVRLGGASGSYVFDRCYGSSGGDVGLAIASDPSSNTILGGYFRNSINFGGGPLTSAGNSDIYLVKLDQFGFHTWSTACGHTLADQVNDLACDSGGNIYATGRFNGTVNFGAGAMTSAGGSDIFVARFSPGGTTHWSHNFGSTGTDDGLSLAAGPADGVTYSGHFHGTVDFDPTAGVATLTAPGVNGDGCVSRLNADGTW